MGRSEGSEMKSFANYRWILAITMVVAVLAVFFGRPKTAWAGATNNNAQGPAAGICTQGEGVSASNGTTPNCASCVEPTTSHPASSSATNYSYSANLQFTTYALERGPDLGNLESAAGNAAMPGTGDGMLNPHWGSVTMTMSIGICGTSLGFGREGANVVATNTQDNPGLWTTPTEEIEIIPEPDG